MDDHASFGYWVRRRRKALDLTQEALAQQVGCSVMTIRKIEGDVRRPSRQIAELLAEHLALPIDERAAFIKAARAELAVDRLPRPTEQTDRQLRQDAAAEADAPDLGILEAWQPGRASLPNGTATLLFADVPTSPQLWEHDQSATEAALVRYHAIVRRAIEINDGGVFKIAGDLVCAAFASAPAAIRAALDVQRTLIAAAWDGLEPLRARTAIHTGSVDMHDDDYVGLPLSRIARLLEVGHAGQILLSLATYEMVRDVMPSGADLHDLGSYRLRDLTRPEQIFQLGTPDLPANFPSLRKLDQRRTNLPLQSTPLIGREQEVAQVCALLQRDGVRLLTLTGPGGTGKTRLGLQVAAELLDAFADGVYLVALAPIRDPALVIETIAATLGVREGGNQPLLTLLKQHVHEKQLLLVLDNFEQVIDAAPLVSEVLEAAPGLKLLVTSRASLQLYGESEFPVPPLALPNPSRLPPLDRLTQYEAVRLFIERARAVKPDFTITDATAPAVAEICVRLDGLPLAIELAAVRVKVLTPQALLARLSRRLHVLTGGARNLPARQQTLRGAIAWSHELLPEAEQALFARLAVFASGSTLEAIEAICNADDDGAPDLLDGIQALINNSLMSQVVAHAEPRFCMLETIREYALEQLAARGEEAALCDRHATYYLIAAEAARPKLNTAGQEQWLDQLEAEHDNLRAALTWALERRDRSLSIRLSNALWPFWQIRGYFAEGRRWLSLALEHSEEVAAPLRAAAYTGAGTMAWLSCEYVQALGWHQQALDLYRSLGDTHGIAFALNNVGAQFGQQGDFTAAKQLFLESLALSRQVQDTLRIAGTLGNLGWVFLMQGDYAAAMQCLTESLALAQQLKDARLTADILQNMGEVARYQDDDGRAAELFNQSLVINRRLRNWLGICYSLVALGHVAVNQGNHAQAIAFYAEALALCREHSHREQMAECFEGMACSAARQGWSTRGARLFGAAERLREVIGAPRASQDDQRCAEAVALIQAMLDPVLCAATWEEGRNMPLGQALAYALSDLTL